MESRAESIAKGIAGVGAVVGAIWDLWFVVAVWRSGRLPVPWNWTLDEGHPIAAVVLFLFGLPILSMVVYWAAFIVALPFLMIAARNEGRP